MRLKSDASIVEKVLSIYWMDINLNSIAFVDSQNLLEELKSTQAMLSQEVQQKLRAQVIICVKIARQ